MSMSRRVKIITGAAALFATILVVGISMRRCSSFEPPVEAVPAEGSILPETVERRTEQIHLLVADVRGTAERKRPGRELWDRVKSGDELFADDRLRTGVEAAVRLSIDERSRFELEGRSELSVRELTETVHGLELALGQISVDYDDSPKRLLKIVVSDSDDAVAETRAARFVVHRVGDEVTVATHMGKVKLTAKKESVEVNAGKFSQIRNGNVPIKPEPIPMDVLLKVAAPKRVAPGERSAVVAGKTDVGAAVFLNDAPATVDKSGRFRAAVPIHPGRTQVNVVSRTAWGKAEESLCVTLVPDDGKVKDATVRWGKSGPAKKKRKKKKGTD